MVDTTEQPDICDANVPYPEQFPLGPDDFKQAFWDTGVLRARVRALDEAFTMQTLQIKALKDRKVELEKQLAEQRLMIDGEATSRVTTIKAKAS